MDDTASNGDSAAAAEPPQLLEPPSISAAAHRAADFLLDSATSADTATDPLAGSLSFGVAGPGVAIAIDPVALVTTECITVTSAMRKHARWAHSSVSAILGGSALQRGTSSAGALKVHAARRQSGGLASVEQVPVGADGDSLASRWGLRGKKGRSMLDNPLMSAFARLRSDLRGCKDIRTFDIPSLLHPFLQVIRSSSTSAPITSLALVAITKFFAYNLISRDSPRLPLGMQLLSAAITHCRFEASDSAADEIVLLRILKLMEGMMSGPGGDLLGDESVCEMMETGLSMCCQVRLSELLRRSAEISMIAMCQVIFERLKHLEHEAGGDFMAMEAEREAEDGADVTMDAPLKGTNAASAIAVLPGMESGKATPDVKSPTIPPTMPPTVPSALPPTVLPQENGGDSRTSTSGEPRPSGELRPSVEEIAKPITNGATIEPPKTPAAEDGEPQTIKPYSLPSIRELFRVLVNLLDPHDKQHTDAMRIMALRIIDVALEVAGPSIAKHPSLASLAKDSLCRNLFQLVRSDNMTLLNESLRVAGTLLTTCRSVLKLQQELFLSYLVACLHPKIGIPQEPGIDPRLYEGIPHMPKGVKQAPSSASSGRSTPVPVKDRQKLGMEGGMRSPDAREAMVESIGALTRIPGFLAELFINYDCEVDRGDLCEDMIGLLSRNAFPDSATWSTTNVPPLCLDALLCHIQFMADRLHDEPMRDGYPGQAKLRKQRALKKIVVKGAARFNENPKGGIAYLVKEGVIDNPDDPVSVARFLKGTTRVSKKMLGEFLSKKGNDKLLTAFLDLYDFSGKRVDEALRAMLGTFRLPGESQLIERIVTVFCEKYHDAAPSEVIADTDSLYVLTYAIIMLNTDQHNPNLKAANRMTFEAFARNLRGVNAGQDFDRDYLQHIYDEIKNNEIILPDEHDNKHAFDYAWKELLQKTDVDTDLTLCSTNIFDADMFEATWRPVVATLSYVFMSASEDAVYQRVVAGFDQCAQIAARYGCTEALDRIIFCLTQISTLDPEIPPSTNLNTEVQVGKRSIMVSELAVKFGRDYRAQLATVVLFKGVIANNETTIGNGWRHIINIWLVLFSNSLIPSSFKEARKRFEIPSIPIQSPTHVVNRADRNAGAGLFSSFTSYLQSYAADEPPEPSDEEMNDTLCTVDCIQACPMDEIFARTTALPEDSLAPLVVALLEKLPQETSPMIAVVKPESGATPVKPGRVSAAAASNYDPKVVWVLEFVSILAMKNNTMHRVGKEVAEALQDVVRDSNMHPLVTSRAIFYLLSLLSVCYEHSFIRAPVILHAISSMDRMTAEKAALPILKGLSFCLKGSRTLRNEIVNTPDFWSTIRNLQSFPEAAPGVFTLLMNIVEDSPSAVTADNYESTVLLLNDFATAGSAGAAIEQKRDQRNVQKGGERPKRPAKPQSAKDNEVVARGMRAVQTIFQLTSRVPELIQQSNLERTAAWTAYWSPIFKALSKQCTNPCREIRHQAFGGLQRALLSPELASPDHQEWTAIFGEVLFPLIKQLMKPEVYHSDPVGMSETRVQAATLLCKIFLHYLVLLSEWDGMLELWLRILEIMDRLMNSGQGDSLEEAVPESLKNIVLVMHNGGILVPPAEDASRTQLWDETWKRIDRFLPGMQAELFPAPEPKPEKAEAGKAEKAEKKEEEDKSEEKGEDEAQAEETPAEAKKFEPKAEDVD